MISLERSKPIRMSDHYRANDDSRRYESLRSLLINDKLLDGRFDLVIEYTILQFGAFTAQIDLIEGYRSLYAGGKDWREKLDLSAFSDVVAEDGILVVRDTLRDIRFSQDPVTALPHRIRFYAGAPLTLSDGSWAGCFSFVDRRPRSVDDIEIAHLRDLATVVSRDMSTILRSI